MTGFIICSDGKSYNASEGTDEGSSDSNYDSDMHGPTRRSPDIIYERDDTRDRDRDSSGHRAGNFAKHRSYSVDVKTPDKPTRPRPSSISFDIPDNQINMSPRSDEEYRERDSMDSNPRDSLRRSNSIGERSNRMRERAISTGSQSPHVPNKSVDLPPIIEAKPWYEENAPDPKPAPSGGGCGCIIS